MYAFLFFFLGHKDQVYTVSFSGDGSRFASGGADNIVVIWKITGQGLLKYNHAAPIQKVAYSPTMLLLASCSEVDFGLWTPDQKQVVKDKVSSRILSAAWSSDGSMLALGMLSGLISIRNQSAQEIFKIERKAPIWCMTFVSDTTGPNKAGFPASMLNFGGGNAAGPTSSNEMNDSLAVGCWDKTYSLYRINNNTCKIQHEKKLKYYPCSIAYSANQASKSSYLIITGSNKKATVYSREGSKLTEIASKDSWVWCCDSNGDSEVLYLIYPYALTYIPMPLHISLCPYIPMPLYPYALTYIPMPLYPYALTYIPMPLNPYALISLCPYIPMPLYISLCPYIPMPLHISLCPYIPMPLHPYALISLCPYIFPYALTYIPIPIPSLSPPYIIPRPLP